jgi:preprotein translocase subunit SecA
LPALQRRANVLFGRGLAKALKKKAKRARSIPDDYFARGPFESARFGRLIISRFRGKPEEHDAYVADLAAAFPRVIAEIDELALAVAAKVARLPCHRLLQRAWWEFAAAAMGLKGASLDDPNQFAALRMIDYVQSVAASVKPSNEYSDHVSDEDWAGLKADVQSLFARLSSEYQACLTASNRIQDPKIDMEMEEFRVRTEICWMNVRGKRYQPHERQALTDVLGPHSDVLVRLFGIDAPSLISELEKILSKLTRGLGDALSSMADLQQEALARMARLAEETSMTNIDELRDRVFAEDSNLAASRDQIAGEIFGLDLFDVKKITRLPKKLLDELAWSPGEEAEFFAPGELCGWPLRVWPTMKRPFIRLEDRILCFDGFALRDNFYRVLQRAIFRLAPEYRQTWNKRQKIISEDLPFRYILRLLPGARIYQSIYYRWRRTEAGPYQWCEADGIVIYDDHLFVIEIKAGAFTYTSPATDLAAHLASLRGLVLAPASQGNRFIDFLESSTEVSIADASHNEVGRLRRADFRHVAACAITLDQFTELAARSHHLRSVGIDLGHRPIWVLSIDDLRVYADLFDNPLVFLHFVEQRMRADRSEIIDLNDEMDHLGLYLATNNYAQYASKIAAGGPSKINFTGYRTPIDGYYSAIVQGDTPTLPKQGMPERLAEIVALLGTSRMPNRSAAASFLLDSAGDFRTKLAGIIEEQLSNNKELLRARPLSVYDEMAFTLFCWSPSAPRQAAAAFEHVQTVMAANSESSRHLLELEYTSTGVLKEVHWRRVELTGRSDAEMVHLQAAARALREQRVVAAQKRGKIGPNEKCPCGSGRKYKRCHRP